MRDDVIVVGGGLVGAASALALAQAGRRVVLVEGRTPDFTDLTEGWDARVYAISPANRAFLQALGAWPEMSRVGTIRAMDVRGDAGGRIGFAAEDAGGDALAWIVENRWLLAALWRALPRAGVECVCGVQPQALQVDPHAARLTLSDGTVREASLLVGADGANSWVRDALGITASVKPYGHSGVVANFACARAHGGVARQWFTGRDVLAWLPMAGDRISMVWSTATPEALLQLTPAALCETVAAAGGHALGALQCLTPAAAFPLRLIRPQCVIGARALLVGDAAHTVHPLAGQGVNLGFADAALVAQLLHGARDPGSYLLLRRYERARLAPVRTMQYTCDALFQLFQPSALPALGWLRNTGLTLTDRLPGLRRLLARQAVGF